MQVQNGSGMDPADGSAPPIAADSPPAAVPCARQPPAEEVAGPPAAADGGVRPLTAWPWRRGVSWLTALVRRNLLFTVALGLAALVRVVVMLGYRPALLIRLDSYFYLSDATKSVPDPDNTNGYPFFLRLLEPFHSLALIAGVQHVMGLVIAVIVYAVLRRQRVPAWASTLAAAPVLFDSRELLVEHAIMADTLATLLMIIALAVLLSRQHPSYLRSATAGLLMGLSAVVRPTALPLIVLVALYLLVRRTGWTKAGAALLAGLIPVAGYVAWFAASYGVLNLTNSSGLFLWARTTSFANCKVIKPPADLKALCPSRNPGHPGLLRPNPDSWSTLQRQQTPQTMLWARRDWPWQPRPKSGYESYNAAFTPAKNKLAQQFAIRAIEAQPAGYAKVVAEGIAQTFLDTDTTWRWPVSQPHTDGVVAGRAGYETNALRAYLGSTDGLTADLGTHLGTRVTNPAAGYLTVYDKIVFLPGILFALAFLAGLGGLIYRRSMSPALLLWVCAVVVLVLPIAENQYNYRYALPAVPLVCMTVALVIFGREPQPATEDARPGQRRLWRQASAAAPA